MANSDRYRGPPEWEYLFAHHTRKADKVYADPHRTRADLDRQDDEERAEYDRYEDRQQAIWELRREKFREEGKWPSREEDRLERERLAQEGERFTRPEVGPDGATVWVDITPPNRRVPSRERIIRPNATRGGRYIRKWMIDLFPGQQDRQEQLLLENDPEAYRRYMAEKHGKE